MTGVGGEEHCANLVSEALRAGVKMIDTAQAPEWYSEKSVGRGLEISGISGISGISNSNASSKNKNHPNHPYPYPYLVTKVHPRSFRYDSMKAAVLNSKEQLKLDNDTPIDLVRSTLRD